MYVYIYSDAVHLSPNTLQMRCVQRKPMSGDKMLLIKYVHISTCESTYSRQSKEIAKMCFIGLGYSVIDGWLSNAMVEKKDL